MSGLKGEKSNRDENTFASDVSSEVFFSQRGCRCRWLAGTSWGIDCTAISEDLWLVILSYVSFAPGEGIYSHVGANENGISKGTQTQRPPSTKSCKKAEAVPFGGSLFGDTSFAEGPSSKDWQVKRGWNGTLTHVLPLVCRDWYVLCHMWDALWKDALMRLAMASDIWREGLEHYSRSTEKLLEFHSRSIERSYSIMFRRDFNAQKEVAHNGDKVPLKRRSYSGESGHVNMIVARALNLCASLAISESQKPPQRKRATHPCGNTAEHVFWNVLNGYVKIRVPVIYMPSSRNRRLVKRGSAFVLHMFEPRYCLLISEIMSKRSEKERHGATLQSDHFPRPRFVYVNQGPLSIGRRAYLVEVKRCIIYPCGVADVVLVFAHDVILEEITEHPKSEKLVDALVRLL